jgi:hypothetical protein
MAVTTEETLKRFEVQLVDAGFQFSRSGVNPIVYRLLCRGQCAGQVKVWAPLKVKFNEVRDEWRDEVLSCWAKAQAHPKVASTERDHWGEAKRLFASFEPYKLDFLDFEDLAKAVATALHAEGRPAPDVETMRYDFAAIEKAIGFRGEA